MKYRGLGKQFPKIDFQKYPENGVFHIPENTEKLDKIFRNWKKYPENIQKLEKFSPYSGKYPESGVIHISGNIQKISRNYSRKYPKNWNFSETGIFQKISKIWRTYP